MPRSRLLSALFLVAAAEGALAADTSLSVICAPGDAVCGGEFGGPGNTFLLLPPGATFSTLQWPSPNGVTILVNAPPGTQPSSWTVVFKAPNTDPLVPGRYSGAVRSFHWFRDFPGPSMWIASQSGCNAITGNFDILEVAFDPDGNLLSLWATFDQICANFPVGLRGEIRFNVTPTPIPALGGVGLATLIVVLALVAALSLRRG